jgi:2-octaprenyl-6-methoxyphenol hydroxylase
MQFDIIIIGGGMVGATLACSLRDSQLNIALIDVNTIETSEDHRLIALNYSSYCLFQNLGIWPALKPYAEAINEVHISHRGHFGTTRLTASESDFPTLGYVVPAKYINKALYENLSHITLIQPAKLIDLIQDTDSATLTIETPDGLNNIKGKIIIGADGNHSTVRELLNIPTTKIDYQQSALVTITELQRSHHNIAYERFQKEGAIAMLPLTNNRAATIWTASNTNITELMQLDNNAFLQKLQDSFGYRLGRFRKTEKRYTYPLHMIKAENQVKGRVILIGNAAHALHPIAAQGFNLALYEIAALRDYFSSYSIDKMSLIDFATEQQKMSMQLSHHLTWVFSKDFFILNTARMIGMLSLDLCHPLKEKFTRKAMGQTGSIPSLLKDQNSHESNPD